MLYVHRKTLETPRLLDEAEAQRLLEERQKQILQFKEHRQQVEAWRAQDRALRNQMKIKQLDDAQALQVSDLSTTTKTETQPVTFYFVLFFNILN